MDTAWRVSILPSAQSELDGLDDRVRDEAVQAILDLTEDPFLYGSTPLRGHLGLYRIKFYRGQYRIVYRVSEKRSAVVIWRVRPRGTAYRGL